MIKLAEQKAIVDGDASSDSEETDSSESEEDTKKKSNMTPTKQVHMDIGTNSLYTDSSGEEESYAAAQFGIHSINN